MEIGVVAVEYSVRRHGDKNIQIPRASALRAGLAFAGKADAGAVLDTGGTGDASVELRACHCFTGERSLPQ